MIDAFGFLDKVIFGRLVPTPSPEQIAEMVAAAKEKSPDKIYHMLDEATGDIDSEDSRAVDPYFANYCGVDVPVRNAIRGDIQVHNNDRGVCIPLSCYIVP